MMSTALRRLEAAVAALLTLAAIWLHFVAARSLGGLWRDESNTVAVSTMPTLRDVVSNLQYDSFPILWLLVIRYFSLLAGPLNDPAFRVLGFAVGVGVIGMLWFNARTFGHFFPFFSVLLLGLSPTVILWGDSMRAYGMGILLILLTAALLWRFIEQPTTPRLLAVGAAALASVHTLFYNSVLLLAICVGALAVCAIDRAWKTARLVILVGAVSAVSMLAYVPVIRAAGTWNVLVRMPNYTLEWFLEKLEEAVVPAGSWLMDVWFVLVLLALIGGLFAALRPAARRAKSSGEKAASTRQRGESKRSRRQREVPPAKHPVEPTFSPRQQRVATFAVTTLVIAVPGIFLFLDRLSYPTQPWYYLSLLAIVALCIDAIFGVIAIHRWSRIARLTVVVVVAGASLSTALPAVHVRLTNVDLVVEQLQRESVKGDVIVVTPWYHGVTFARYYRGNAEWTTLPHQVGIPRFHRYDLFQQAMMSPDQEEPIRPVIEKANAALRSGHKVFVVGWFGFPPPDHTFAPLSPAPLPDGSWPSDYYANEWSLRFARALQRQATEITPSPVLSPTRVNPFEDVSLIVASGWRP